MAQENRTGSDNRKANRPAIFRPVFSGESVLPIAPVTVQVGFPSPADDHPHDTLDLNQYLIKNPASTFLLRAAGESMTDVGIFPDDLLVVDRIDEPASGDIVIAIVDGEFTVKRLFDNGRRIELRAENPEYQPIPLGDYSDVQIWGVVRHVIHSF
jgi:DNA polymerase V